MILTSKLSPSAHQHILIRGLSLTPPHQFHYFPYPVPSEHALRLRAHGLEVLQRIAWGSSLKQFGIFCSFQEYCLVFLWSPRAQLCALRLRFFRNFPSSSQSLVFLLSGAIRKNVVLILEHSRKLALLYLWQSLTILCLWQKPTDFPSQFNFKVPPIWA